MHTTLTQLSLDHHIHHTSSHTIIYPYNLTAFSLHFIPGWELIVNQVDARNNLFQNTAKTTFTHNQANPDSKSFMKIGSLDWNKYRNANSQLEFKVQWSGGNAADQVLQWKQTSTPQESTISGYIPGVGAPTGASGCEGFTGLGRSDSGSCVVDGNGAGSCWWNCVGAVGCHSPQCIPANGGKTATDVQLWIKGRCMHTQTTPAPAPHTICHSPSMHHVCHRLLYPLYLCPIPYALYLKRMTLTLILTLTLKVRVARFTSYARTQAVNGRPLSFSGGCG